MGGAVMLLGALAYRSAKKRKFGEAKSTLMRYFWEITLLVPIFGVIFAVILRPNNFSYLIETKPVQNLLIAIGAIAAYVVAGIRATARPTPVVAEESFRLPRSSRAPH
jgi:putative copper export protein